MNIEGFLSAHFIFLFEFALCVSVVVVALIGVFLAYRRLAYMEGLLNKCSFIEFHSRFWDDSPRGRMMRLSAITVTVLMPKRCSKRGVIDWQQVQQFPRGFKRLFGGMLIVSIIFLLYGAIVWLPLKCCSTGL